jgi:hypothetical protein
MDGNRVDRVLVTRLPDERRDEAERNRDGEHETR